MNEPTLNDALQSVEFELPDLDDKTQAILAAHLFKARVFEHGINRLVSSINDLIVAMGQEKSEVGGEGAAPKGAGKGFMEMSDP